MNQDDLLSTLRNLEPMPEPDHEALVLEKLTFLTNVLEDLKLKQSITNELLLELVEQGKSRNRSDFASQARPFRNNSPSSPIRKWK